MPNFDQLRCDHFFFSRNKLSLFCEFLMSGREKRSKNCQKGKSTTKIRVRANILESITNYVNDASCLKNDIKEVGFPLMGRFDFVSLSEDNVLRILISGSCPNCNAFHIRNTCNNTFCKEVMTP